MTTFKSRKFLLSLFVVLLATVLLWFQKLDGAQFVMILSWIVPAYLGSNVVQKFAERRTAESEPVLPMPYPG